MCSCHENKEGDDGGGGGEKKTVLFKKDRGAEQTTKGEKKQSPVIAFAIKQSAGDSKCTVEGMGFGGAAGKGGGGRGSTLPTSQGRWNHPACRVCGADDGQQEGGFISRCKRQTTKNIPRAKDDDRVSIRPDPVAV